MVNTDQPSLWTLASENYRHGNFTDAAGVQRADLTKDKRDYNKLWASFRKSWSENQDYLKGAGGLGMEIGRQEVLITIEQNNM